MVVKGQLTISIGDMVLENSNFHPAFGTSGIRNHSASLIIPLVSPSMKMLPMWYHPITDSYHCRCLTIVPWYRTIALPLYSSTSAVPMKIIWHLCLFLQFCFFEPILVANIIQLPFSKCSHVFVIMM